MACSWSTVLNPLNMLHALWDFAVYCWRRFEVFWARITNPDEAPTVDRIAAFQLQSMPREGQMRRDFSLEARHGSMSSMHDSPLSERSPSHETFSLPETASQSQISGHFGEQYAALSDPMQAGDQIQQDTPLLHRQASQRSQEKPPTSSGSSSNKADSSDKSYSTF